MAVLPSLMMGLTSMGSQAIGVYSPLLATHCFFTFIPLGMKQTSKSYLGGGEDVLDGLSNLGADTVTLDQADEVVSLFIL